MGWFSDLINGVTKTESVDFYVSPALAIGTQLPAPAPLVPDECYISVRVASLRLPYTRQKIVERLYGVVHAFAHLSSRFGEDTEFAAATMPNKLAGVDPKNLQNVITIDKLVVGPTPWAGGDFALELGLFSVVSENLAGPFLETISKLTETVGVGFASAAKPYVDTIKFGVMALTRASGSVKLEIGLDKTLTPPTTGTFALVATPVGKLSGKTLSIDPIDKKLLVNSVHYTDQPYLVFSIESSTQRSDWGEIPDLKAAYAAVRKAVIDNDQSAADQTFKTFRRLANISPDLISADAQRLVARVENQLKSAFQAAGNAGVAMTFPEFHEIELY